MNRFLLSAMMMAMVLPAMSQERSSSSMYLQPQAKSDVMLFYSVDGEGTRFQPTWGLDLAWISEQNLRKGVRHMGKDNVGIGRSAFRATEVLVNDTDLGSGQIATLRERSNLFNTVCGNTLPLVLTADQEAANTPAQKAGDYYVKNKVCNTDHWAAMINAHVAWMQKNSQHPVVGVSPYNEPDYWSVEEGASVARQVEVARKLRENYAETMKDVAIVGGNTLNNDKALEWYQTGKSYYGWGNTHQLAGSFDTFAAFYQQLKADGKTGYGDEMHNVGEAMVGLEYGMSVGIWWGFDSRARGEFCDISRNGERLAYGEHRENWTAASVYRHDDGRVKAFIGSSERQAKTTTYGFVSTDRDVYYDTQGPLRTFCMEIPGGTGYQKGQTNAERVIDIQWGEDVPHVAITDGIYRFVNKYTGNYLNATTSTIAMQQNFIKSQTQQWNVKRIDSRIGGDYSFFDIEQVKNEHLHINVQNFSTFDGAKVIPYMNNTTPDSNEQWYFEYAGDGFFYIRNRETALYLTANTNKIAVQTNELQSDPQDRERQMWRLLPAGIVYDTEAPAKPAGLTAKAQPASISLTWQANTDKDLRGYNIFRTEAGQEAWSVIARDVKTPSFVDNNCRPGHNYIYIVKALDEALNLSEASETVTSAVTDAPALIARWTMNGTLNDTTVNMMDAAAYENESYAAGNPDLNTADITYNGFSLGSRRYIQLPYEVASHDELTFCAWVKCLSLSSTWQRIFDFGNGTSQYMFLTANAGNSMRFAIKNGGDEQTLDCDKLPVAKWRHVAVTIGQGRTAIYIDGEEAASTTNITIRPSDICPSMNYLGRSQFDADPAFLGTIQDVRIYNYALNADEVKKAMSMEVESAVLEGDVNEDGAVDVADISAIISVMAGTDEYERADVNGDGAVDVADISTVISIMAE